MYSKKVGNLLDTMKYSSNSESESADETETSEENNSSEADEEELSQEEPFQADAQTNSTPTNECLLRRFVDDGNHLQIFLRGDSSKTQVPLRVEVFRLLQK